MPGTFHDAIILPKRYIQAKSDKLRFHRTFDLLEQLLGVDRAAGERAWAREIPGERLFVTKSSNDTLLVPHGQPGAENPRYSWTEGDRGIQYGKLIDYAAGN